MGWTSVPLLAPKRFGVAGGTSRRLWIRETRPVSASQQVKLFSLTEEDMKAEARFTHSAIRFDEDQTVHMVLSLTAPATEWQTKRPPLCIVPAIDVSGSMGGDKMEYAKQSVLKLIDHLGPQDRCGLVTFESSVRVVSSVVQMTPENKTELRRAVTELGPLGGTNFVGGMLAALDLIDKADLPVNYLTRVIMFTDGQANTGVTSDPVQIVAMMSANLGRATVSAFGYGSDVNQAMLADLSDKGKGNYASVKHADDALSAFGKELGGLLSTYAQDIEVEMTPKGDHKIKGVISDVAVEESDVLSEVTVKIPDILAEETRHIALTLDLGKQKQALPRPVTVLDLVIRYALIGADGRRSSVAMESKGKIRFVKPGEEQKTPTREVDAIVALAQLGRAQKEADQHVQKGDYRGAARVMKNAAHDVGARGHVQVQGLLDGMSLKYQSPVDYAQSSTYLTSMGRVARRGMGVSSADEKAIRDCSEFLYEYEVGISNQAQQLFSQAFESDSVVIAPPPPPVPSVAAVPDSSAAVFPVISNTNAVVIDLDQVEVNATSNLSLGASKASTTSSSVPPPSINTAWPKPGVKPVKGSRRFSSKPKS